jgi:hypothetical protein
MLFNTLHIMHSATGADQAKPELHLAEVAPASHFLPAFSQAD